GGFLLWPETQTSRTSKTATCPKPPRRGRFTFFINLSISIGCWSRSGMASSKKKSKPKGKAPMAKKPVAVSKPAAPKPAAPPPKPRAKKGRGKAPAKTAPVATPAAAESAKGAAAKPGGKAPGRKGGRRSTLLRRGPGGELLAAGELLLPGGPQGNDKIQYFF